MSAESTERDGEEDEKLGLNFLSTSDQSLFVLLCNLLNALQENSAQLTANKGIYTH